LIKKSPLTTGNVTQNPSHLPSGVISPAEYKTNPHSSKNGNNFQTFSRVSRFSNKEEDSKAAFGVKANYFSTTINNNNNAQTDRYLKDPIGRKKYTASTVIYRNEPTSDRASLSPDGFGVLSDDGTGLKGRFGNDRLRMVGSQDGKARRIFGLEHRKDRDRFNNKASGKKYYLGSK
jgi:hypothetical protein